MALTVEDGTMVSGANSYVSDAEYVAYAAARGKTIGSDEATREIELIKAMDFIESHRDKFKGIKRTQDQALQWPRYNVAIDGYTIENDVIPDELKNAQMEAGMYLNSAELLRTGSVQDVQREKLGQLEVSYFNGGSYEVVRADTVDVYLNPLLKKGGGGLNAVAVRA